MTPVLPILEFVTFLLALVAHDVHTICVITLFRLGAVGRRFGSLFGRQSHLHSADPPLDEKRHRVLDDFRGIQLIGGKIEKFCVRHKIKRVGKHISLGTLLWRLYSQSYVLVFFLSRPWNWKVVAQYVNVDF